MLSQEAFIKKIITLKYLLIFILLINSTADYCSKHFKSPCDPFLKLPLDLQHTGYSLCKQYLKISLFWNVMFWFLKELSENDYTDFDGDCSGLSSDEENEV